MVRAGGIEPTANGLKVRSENDVSGSKETTCNNDDEELCHSLCHNDDFETLKQLWPGLPEQARKAILELAKAYVPHGER